MEKVFKFKKPIIVLLFFIGLETLSSYYISQFPQFSDSLPHIEAHPTLPYHIRRNIFEDDNYYLAQIQKGRSISQIKGEYSLFGLEGLVRHAKGDTVINKWGFEGPYFNKKSKPDVFRIISLGDSTTLGEGSPSEVTYPRHLERMLNNSKTLNRPYQVINFGHWAYGICDIRFMFDREALEFEPDMALIMAGFNDVLRLGMRMANSRQFCDSGSWVESVKWGRSFKVLLKNMLKKLPRPKQKPISYRFQPQNLSYYRQELERIIQIADKKGISLGLISLSTQLETSVSRSDASACEDVSGEECERDKKYILLVEKVNQLYQELAELHSHVFFINNGVSLNSSGKNFFFKKDKAHLTGSGNRILAYGVKLAINDRLKIDSELPKPFTNQTISSNQLEIEYLKSLFLSNKIEDLIYSGCVVFNDKCIYTDSNRKEEEWSTSVVEFSLGSFLQYEKGALSSDIKIDIENLLKKVIAKNPKFSLAHWVLAQVLSANGERASAKKHEIISFELNPLLKDFDFGVWKRFFNDRHIDNPMVTNLKEVVDFLKTGPNYNLSYLFASSIVGRDLKSYPKELNLKNFKNLYYSSPLLVRSIYKKALDYLIEINDYDKALEIVRKVKVIKPQYGSFGLFASYEKKIESLIKMKNSLNP
jgi:tetratricopeptide (TPR) repeat protein